MMTDQERSFFYRLFARLLITPADQDLLDLLQQIQPATDGDPFSLALGELRSLSSSAVLKALDDDFHQLFIGLGKGQLSPYLSWYQTGFLMEKPLALLRQDLIFLGIKRQSETVEPEDHISALCEVMALLIADNRPEQTIFFQRYLQPWASRFFTDLGNSGTGLFYPAVAKSGLAFMNLESQRINRSEHES
jgi:TorA maturation chaperone TorD